MANQSPQPEGKPVQFRDELDEAFSLANPNPERVRCPGAEVLAELATRQRPIGDPGYEHLAECSPCYREFRAIQTARRLNRDQDAHGADRRWLVFAAAALLIVALSAVWLLLDRHQAARVLPSARTEEPTTAAAQIDLRPFSVARGDRTDEGLAPVSLPARRIEVTLLLPVGSEPGFYNIQLLDANLKPLVSSSGSAEIQNYITTLRTPLDLHLIPSGSYSLAVRRQGESWRMFPARVQ